MFKKTHVLIGLFVVLYFLPVVNNKLVFFPMVLLASIIPDLDSVIAPKKNYRILQPLKNQSYKDFMHSYTICVILSIVLAIFFPVLALPFFVGYSSHLFFDSFTVSGIIPFWPFRSRITGFVLPGSRTERILNIIFGFLVIVMVFRYLF